MSVLGQWDTRLRKRGKKKRRFERGCVRVLGGLLGYGREAKKEESRGTYEGTGWATRLRKRGRKRMDV